MGSSHFAAIFKFGFGDYEGRTLTMLPWHSVQHETESGDIAPGFGEFTVEMEEIENDGNA